MKAYIAHKYMAGSRWYCVFFYNNPGIWLDLFKTLEDAEQYCFARDFEYDQANDLIEDVPHADMG